MARGIGRMMGIRLMLNFNNPYLATGLGDFWRRWHISLSTWFRDYLYIPLGGNRKGEIRTYVNICLTMVVSGLWHGAMWTFVIWGALHAVGYSVTRALERAPLYRQRVPQLTKQLFTFGFVTFAWIFFRAQSVSDAWLIVTRIAYFDGDTLPEWTIDHPYVNPASAITLELSSPNEPPSPAPVAKPWTEKHLSRFNPEWVDVETSFQWTYFCRTIETLERRGNRVFVLIGPFNEHMLTDEALRGYKNIHSEAETWLIANGIAYYAPSTLPSEYYADASHPLAEGYELLAKDLFENEGFHQFYSKGIDSSPRRTLRTSRSNRTERPPPAGPRPVAKVSAAGYNHRCWLESAQNRWAGDLRSRRIALTVDASVYTLPSRQEEPAMSDSLNRRQFLGTTAAGGVLLAGQLGTRPLAAAEEEGWPKPPPVRIYKIYVGRTGGIYLSRPTDEIEKFEKHLAGVEKKLGDVKFIGGELIPPAKLDEVAAKLKEADGVLLFHLSGHGGGAPALGKLVDLGLPTAVFSQPFSGHGWMYFPAWQKAGKKVVLLPTSDWSEIDRVVGLMRVAPRMRQTKILAVGHRLGTEAACSIEDVKKKLGTEVIPIDNKEVIAAHGAIDLKAAEAEAEEYWFSKAKKIVEPKREEIISSARMYLAVKGLMLKYGARATTSSHCMGLPAKGCLTYSKLNDLGMVGACEGDMDSTLTMLMFQYAFGLPGFISDPVFDTASNALIHFHCTSSTRMDGPAGKRLPFTIRTQSDSERGVALEVEQRIGQAVTCAKFVNADTMLISTGKIFKVTHDELGCRTQFWTEVEDARSMFLNWGGGVLKGGTMTLLHRVVFYGNHMQAIQDLATLMGTKIVVEG